MPKTRTYHCWIDMRRRCNGVNRPDYCYYGGRGIKVCPRWDLYENFLADMGEKPPGLTLERRDVNKDYTPENCCWATRKDQSRNRTDTVRLTKDGVTRTLAEWAEVLGLKAGTIHNRLWKGASEEEELAPANPRGRIRRNNRMLTLNGITKAVYEWAVILGISTSTLNGRIANGWSDERILTTPVR